ncbi:DUF5133 domain-containing protein [Streptomyces sp. MMS24-I2-30]|uniref:DUF5133 domain-containing protein n=1 Tax=Streptomyces sp. MMS24-I2-30 TaxID=3351564 RepID=UPI003896A483
MEWTIAFRTVTAALRSYRLAHADLLRDPASPLRHRRPDDTAYSLCVLLGQRDIDHAVAQAESLSARPWPKRRAPA